MGLVVRESSLLGVNVFAIECIVGHTSEYPSKYNYVRSLPYQRIDSPPETIVASIYLYL